MSLDARRLAAVISPLRRALLASTRAADDLPDIPDPQIEIIRALPRGTVTTPGDLAATLGLRRPTVSNLLSAMESAGLVARRASDDDRRRVEVVASAEALGYFDRFDAISAEVVAQAAASLKEADRAALESALPALEQLARALITQQRIGTSRSSHEEAKP